MPHASTATNGRKIARTAARAVLLPVAALVAYCLAALIGSIVPRNPYWRSADAGVTVYVETNGVHSSIVVPIAAAGADLSDIVGAGTAAGRTATHVGIGWGEARVFRHTRRWSDLSLRDAWGAATGSDETLVHVDYLVQPAPAAWRRRLVLPVPQYRRLIALLRAEFARPGDGGEPGYTAYDRFYPGRGRYTGFRTCNVWTADVLAKAGITAPRWSPFQGGVMRWYPAAR